MNRTPFRLLFFYCSLISLLSVVQPARTVAATIAAEVEPNDSIAQANVISLGTITGAISNIADADYFRFSGSAGRVYYIGVFGVCGGFLDGQLDVYAGDGTLLAHESGSGRGAVIPAWSAPASANYFVRVTTDQTTLDPNGDYRLFVLATDTDNSTYDQPEAIAYGAELDRTFELPADFDYYVFNGRAGDVVTVHLSYSTHSYHYLHLNSSLDNGQFRLFTTLDDYGGNELMAVLPADGQYKITVSDGGGSYCDENGLPAPYHLSLQRRSLYVAATRAGKIGGLPFGTNDILAKDASGSWTKVFDGEDVGFKVPIAAFEFKPTGDILISPASEVTLSPMGRVKPQDIVVFHPTQLGENTAGKFSWLRRGKNIGLTTLAEKIDAIALTTAGDVLISTSGSFDVPKQGGGSLKGRDEDLIMFHFDGWSMFFDGRYWSGNYTSFSTEDMRSATLLHDEYYSEFTMNWNHLLFGLQDGYSWRDYGTKRTVAPGDPIGFDFKTGCSFCPESYMFTNLTHGALGFPRGFSSLSVGPDWNK